MVHTRALVLPPPPRRSSHRYFTMPATMMSMPMTASRVRNCPKLPPEIFRQNVSHAPLRLRVFPSIEFDAGRDPASSFESVRVPKLMFLTRLTVGGISRDCPWDEKESPITLIEASRESSVGQAEPALPFFPSTGSNSKFSRWESAVRSAEAHRTSA